MNDEVNEHEKDREYCPLGVLGYQLVEHFVSDVLRNNLRINSGCLLIKGFKLIEDLLLEVSDELLLLILPVFYIFISNRTNLKWETELNEGPHVEDFVSIVLYALLFLDQFCNFTKFRWIIKYVFPCSVDFLLGEISHSLKLTI